MAVNAKKSKDEGSPTKKKTTPRIRKIMTPPKEGTVKRSVIRKAIKEMMAQQSHQ